MFLECVPSSRVPDLDLGVVQLVRTTSMLILGPKMTIKNIEEMLKRLHGRQIRHLFNVKGKHLSFVSGGQKWPYL